jgi:hypothetical protein
VPRSMQLHKEPIATSTPECQPGVLVVRRQAGAIPLTDVLDADRQLLVARNDVESTRADAARAAVRTFRALGGGWDVRRNPSIAAVK